MWYHLFFFFLNDSERKSCNCHTRSFSPVYSLQSSITKQAGKILKCIWSTRFLPQFCTSRSWFNVKLLALLLYSYIYIFIYTYLSLSSHLFLFVCLPVSTYHHLSPSCCLHFPLSSPAVDRIGVRALWPVEQVTALTWPWFHCCAFCHLPVCLSHFNNVNMGQARATENILCPGAHSLEPCCTPEPHMHALHPPK